METSALPLHEAWVQSPAKRSSRGVAKKNKTKLIIHKGVITKNQEALYETKCPGSCWRILIGWIKRMEGASREKR